MILKFSGGHKCSQFAEVNNQIKKKIQSEFVARD